jgi:hypothetical protein
MSGLAADPGLAAAFLAQLRRGDIDAIALTVAAQRGGRQVWEDLAARLSENTDPAEPDDPEAAAYCDWCGSTKDLGPDEYGTGDVPCTCHGMVTRPCLDEGACMRRREERFPPDPARCPAWLLELARDSREAGEVGDLVRAAADTAAREFIAELPALRDDAVVALTDPGAWAAAQVRRSGWYDATAAYHSGPWHHTISGGAHNRTHLISGMQQGGDIPQGQQPGQPARPPDLPPRRRRGGRYGARRRRA